MKADRIQGSVVAILIAISLISNSCSPPVLNSITPIVGFPRQIVEVQGSNLLLTAVIWDAGKPGELDANQSFLNSNYFQIPETAGPGNYPVKLANYGGMSANTINVAVNKLSGDWPAPRIEDITYRMIDINAAQNTATIVMFIAVANVDAKATILINNNPVESFLYSAIPADDFVNHKAITYGYPIYHYGQLICGQKVNFGDVLKIKVNNIDNKTDTITFTVPKDEASIDSDNDGLLDSWEINGYSSGGSTIDLHAMGCDPYKKDILVEVDWLAVAQPDPTIWPEITNIFASAPVLNPDGSRGISLHIDRGQGAPFTEGGSILPDDSYIGFGPISHSEYTDFFKYKSLNFKAERLQIFHYCIFAREELGGTTGVGEIWGNDFYITLYKDSYWGNKVAEIGTFVHELGHNLGLRHGGIDNGAPDQEETYKVNQPSSMNYRYQKIGFSLGCNIRPGGIQSYSKGMYKVIREQGLNEMIGLCDFSPVDFNFDGQYNTRPDLSIDVNGDSDFDDIHFDYDEWGHLKLNFLAPGSRWCSN